METTKIDKRKAKNAQNANPAIKDFTDLVAWKLARELRNLIYDLSGTFPRDERHILTAQIRRAVISVTANLAEGYGRYSYQENSQFCRQSRGSAYEVCDHLTTALDRKYVSEQTWKDSDSLARRVIQVLNGYIRATLARRRSGHQA